MSAELKKQGLCELKAGRLELAIDALSAYLNATPDDYEAATAIAMACHRLGRREEAHQRFEGLLRQYPNSASVRYHYGLILEKEGKVDQARVWYKAALRLKPGFATVRKRLDDLNHPPTELLSHADATDLGAEATAVEGLVAAPPALPDTQPEVVVNILPDLDEAPTAVETDSPVLDFELLLPEAAAVPDLLAETVIDPIPVAAAGSEVVHQAVLLGESTDVICAVPVNQDAGEPVESKSFRRKKEKS